MSVAKHLLVAAMADDPEVSAAGGLTPTRWNEDHTILYTLQTLSAGTYNQQAETDAQGRILDDLLACTGTLAINVATAVGSGRSFVVVADTGTAAITINRTGSDTISGLTSLTLTRVGDAVRITDYGIGKWVLSDAKGGTPTNSALALAAEGASIFAARADHQHGGGGRVAVITAEVGAGPSENTEKTIIQGTLPTGFLEEGTTFRFKVYGTVQLQATSGTLTWRIYIGANAGQTVSLVSVTSALTRVPCAFEGQATVRTSGAAGTFIADGEFYAYTSATAVRNAAQGGETTTAVDTTAENPVVKLTAQFATSSATNILRIQQGSIIAL